MPEFGFDKWIDAQLRNVPLPPEFISRLSQQGPLGPDGDARLDAVLRNVPVPPNLEARLMRIARPRRAPLWRQMAMAASIFLLLGAGVAGYVGLLTGGAGSRELFTAQLTPENGNAAEASVVPGLAEAQDADASRGKSNRAASDRADVRRIAANTSTNDENEETAAEASQPASFANGVAALGASLKQAMDAHRRSQAALGAGGELARLPALDALEMSAPRGMAPPMVSGYDLLFELKHGDHPFVSPSANKELRTFAVPLTFRTASYDLALRGLENGQLPAPDEIRVEEFVAAHTGHLPSAPPGELALHLAASPSPLGAAGLHLLELAVQAPSKHEPHPPTRLVVVLDTSAAMFSGARWEAALRGLAKTAMHMTPRDRMTLIGFAEQSRVLAENVSQDELLTLVADGSLPRPAGSADLAAAVRSASEVLRSLAPAETRRVVFVTSGREDFDDGAMLHCGAALAQLSSAKIPWQIVRCSAGQPDSQWAALAAKGHGEISQAVSPAEIHEVLARKLTGRFAAVAGGATLKLRFNPDVVTSYRLLGHEATTITGANDRLEVDLPAGETASGLFELVIKPQGQQLAVAELTWRDPETGQRRGKTDAIFRSQVSPSFAQAPGWFQQGVIAAKTAEALRGSFYATGPHPFGKILELASQVDSNTAEQPEFQGLLRLVKQADKRR